MTQKEQSITDDVKMSGYKLHKAWFAFALNNPQLVTPTQGVLYLYCVEHCNSLGWPKTFGLPASLAMASTGIKSYNTYIKAFNELVEFGFIVLVEKSRNQYTANIIALSNFNRANNRADDKASDSTGNEAVVVYKNNKPTNKKTSKLLIDIVEPNGSEPTQEISPNNEVLQEGGNVVQIVEESPLNGKFEENNSLVITPSKKEKSCAKKESKTGSSFVKPALEEVKAYCEERRKGIDPEKWFDYYTANGWKVGRNTMKDWRASIRTWEKNEISTRQPPQSKVGSLINNIEDALRSEPIGQHTYKDTL